MGGLGTQGDIEVTGAWVEGTEIWGNGGLGGGMGTLGGRGPCGGTGTLVVAALASPKG